MRKSNYFIGIFLISLATLLLELSLTRVMSVSLWYHFGFLVISTALLGFGTAGVVLASWKRLREEYDLGKTLSILSLLFGLITILSFWLLQKIPFNPFNVRGATPRNPKSILNTHWKNSISHSKETNHNGIKTLTRILFFSMTLFSSQSTISIGSNLLQYSQIISNRVLLFRRIKKLTLNRWKRF